MSVTEDFVVFFVKMKENIFAIFVVLRLIGESQIALGQAENGTLKLQNLDPQCLRCLCHVATECDLGRDCISGYCGPYKISRLYWIDAGKVTLPEDDIERAGAFEDCTFSYPCAQKLVVNYMAKYGRDCNNDGVTDCEDYMMIHYNGGVHCDQPLDKKGIGKEWLQRYEICNPKSI